MLEKFKTTIKEANETIAYKATKIFGSMGTFWFFICWAILPLIPFLSPYKETILYISSGFIQLVALPLILVGQEILGRDAEARSLKDHFTIQSDFEKTQMLLDEIRDMHKDTHSLLEIHLNVEELRNIKAEATALLKEINETKAQLEKQK
jgi:hypothetical protein